MSRFRKLLNKTCDILSETRTQSSSGSITKSWTVTTEDVPTRASRPSRETVINNDYTLTLEDYIFGFMPDVNISKENRIRFEDKDYQVMSVQIDSSEHHKTAYGRIIAT